MCLIAPLFPAGLCNVALLSGLGTDGRGSVGKDKSGSDSIRALPGDYGRGRWASQLGRMTVRGAVSQHCVGSQNWVVVCGIHSFLSLSPSAAFRA